MKKKQKHFSIPDHQLAETLIFIIAVYEKTNKNKIEFLIIFVGIIVKIVFHIKNCLKFLVKSLLRYVFLLIT